ncbi:ankyrin repeat-containing domain protein [Pyronema omphalodes]|nr:ankyrin repeat-containing domain protein [Pyronema omphalodes]
MNTPLLPERPAIHEAAEKGHLASVEKLLAENPKLANSVDDDGRLPLHWAITNNHKAIVELLHSTKGFDPDASDTRGWTPLMMAASIKDGEEIVKLLLAYGAMVNAQSMCSYEAI